MTVFTDTSSGSLGTNLVQTAYDLRVRMALRTNPCFRQFATVSPDRPAMKGASIVMQEFADLPVNKTPLSEAVDPDPVQIPNTVPTTVTALEQGTSTIVTHKLELTALTDVNNPTVNIITYNMLDTLDEIIQDVIRGGSQVIRENDGSLVIGGATNAVKSTDTAKSRDWRVAVAKLRGNKVIPWSGSDFFSVVHPDVSMDLRSEITDAGGWRFPNVYGAEQGRIWAGEIGHYEGCRFIESPRCYSAKDGESSGRVHRSYVFARDAIAECVFEEPHVVIGPVVDRLKRLHPYGWYGVIGWSRYREAAMFRIENAVTIPAP